LTPGPKTALVSIASDDPDENPYTFVINGEGGTAPEINLYSGSTNLPSGGVYDFGSVDSATTGSAVTFTVENIGTADLTLSGTPDKVAITGADAAQFRVDSQPVSPIATGVNGHSSFVITFMPSGTGARTALVSIANSDSDENPYTFTVSGTAVTIEINVERGTGNTIASGGSYDFGSVAASASSGAITFTIGNLGTYNLLLTGTPDKVVISGMDFSEFKVDSQPASPVAPVGSVTFTISFNPAIPGPKEALVSIANNDADENPYTFTVTGTGTE
jgi:hypothetical protein